MDLRKLKLEQIQLSKKVKIKNDFEKLELVAGIDHTYNEKDNTIISGIVVVKFPELKVIERKYAIKPCTMPYIPGFLAYREMPSAAEAYSMLDNKPDLVMLDGNGILHPRRFGIASHFGVLQDVPSIGIAKKLLVGEVKEGKVYVEEEWRGMELSTKEKANPLYISPGHRITITKALEVVKQCIVPPHKLPEPVHLAHRFVRKLKEEFAQKVMEQGQGKQQVSKTESQESKER